MTVKLLTEQQLKGGGGGGAAQASLSLHLSKCHIVGNHMSRLKCCLKDSREGMMFHMVM